MGATNHKEKNVISKAQLDELREQIDAIDDEIACLIQARMSLVSLAASLKSESGEGAVSSVREKSILEHGALLEEKYHLPASLMQDLQRRILRESYIQKGSGAFAQAHINHNTNKQSLAHSSPNHEAHNKDTTSHSKLVSHDQNLHQCGEPNTLGKHVKADTPDTLGSPDRSGSLGEAGKLGKLGEAGRLGQSGDFKGCAQEDELLFDQAQVDTSFKVCIVGGKGAMGRFFARYLAAASYEVSVVDVEDYSLDLQGHKVSDIKLSRAAYYLSRAQWCIVSVPIDVTIGVVEQVSALINQDCVLSDLTSVKSDIMEAMLHYHQGPVMGLHPMFGPDTFSLVKQVVVAVAGRNEERCAFIIEQLKLFGARVVECSAKEHDDAMRVIQALRHFTTIAYGNFLKESFSSLGQSSFISRLLELSSPIYRLELMMVGRLFAQDPRLYCEIISSSPQNFELIENYVACAQHCLDKLKNDDKAGFIQDFNDTTKFFGEFAKLFLQESGSILALVQDTYHV